MGHGVFSLRLGLDKSMTEIASMLCHDRKGNLYSAARRCCSLEGEFIECGVSRGGSASIILKAMRDGGCKSRLHLFDSWEGLCTPSAPDPARLKAGDLKADLDEELARQPEVVIHRGFIDATIEQFPTRIAYAHLDLDLKSPTALALNRIAPYLNRFGLITVDDYDERFSGVMLAVNEFLTVRDGWRFETVAGHPDNAVNLWRNL